MELSRTLIKTDKNGTEYFAVRSKCLKCGGTGYINYFHYHDGGICYDCDGSGVIDWEDKIYTPEYAAKLAEKAEARRQKKIEQDKREAAGQNRIWMEREGFSEEGKTYVVLGKNTYDIKDQLKEAGAKYRNLFGWVFPFAQEEFPTVEISVEEVACTDYAGRYIWTAYSDIVSFVKEKKSTAERQIQPESTSQYVGNVGDKIEITLTVVGSFWFDTDFGTTYIHRMADEQGNIFTWKTGTALVGEKKYKKVTLKGTIKEHSEYKEEKQTVLTRCRVISGEEE